MFLRLSKKINGKVILDGHILNSKNQVITQYFLYQIMEKILLFQITLFKIQCKMVLNKKEVFLFLFYFFYKNYQLLL